MDPGQKLEQLTEVSRNGELIQYLSNSENNFKTLGHTVHLEC